MRSIAILFVAILGGCLAQFAAASPGPVILQHGNAWTRINPGSQAGNDIWVVDGWNLLDKEWFWYRVDTPATAGREFSLDALDSSPTVLASDTNGDGQPEHLYLRYANANQGLSVEVDYSLIGGTLGSGRTDLDEGIRITNLAREARTIHFFTYAQFNMSVNEDTAVVKNANTVDQSFLPWHASEVVVTPAPTLYEVNMVPVTLDSLNDGLPTTLNGNLGPMTGEVAWALEWDFTLPAGGSYLISQDKTLTLVPEPATLALVGLGLAAVFCRRRAVGRGCRLP